MFQAFNSTSLNQIYFIRIYFICIILLNPFFSPVLNLFVCQSDLGTNHMRRIIAYANMIFPF